MKSILRNSLAPRGVIIALAGLVVIFFGIFLAARVQAASPQMSSGQRLITVHDNGQERGLLTHATTLRAALKEAGIAIDPNDRIEPGLDEELVANNYEANIYRARPVTIIDGTLKKRVMSPYRTAKQITESAGVTLHDEDIATMTASNELVSQGAAIQLEIDRATPFTLVLYGKKIAAYTQKTTVADMLQSKNITVGENDTLSVSKSAEIKADMKIELWRNGKQTVTVEEKIAFETKQIKDADRPVGYKKVTTTGIDGKKTVTYEIEMKNGKEISRKEIQNVVTKKPEQQVEVIGTKVSLPAGSHEDWMAAAGISSSNYGYINYIFNHESHWNPAAVNPVGYYGLGQTNLNAISSACPQWQSDPICQIKFFDGYAVSRYGSWSSAYDFKVSKGWW